MATTMHKTGPGTLTIGEPGSEIDVSAQVTSVAATTSAQADDDTEVLSGDVIGGDVTYADQLDVTMISDALDASGLVRHSWANRGAVLPFTFVPVNGTGNPSVTGTVRLDPIQLGGEVGARAEVTFTLAGVGTFTVGDAA